MAKFTEGEVELMKVFVLRGSIADERRCCLATMGLIREMVSFIFDVPVVEFVTLDYAKDNLPEGEGRKEVFMIAKDLEAASKADVVVAMDWHATPETNPTIDLLRANGCNVVGLGTLFDKVIDIFIDEEDSNEPSTTKVSST